LKFLKNNKNKNLSLPAENFVNILGEIKPYAIYNNYHILNNDQQSHLYDNKEDELAIKNIIHDDLEHTRNLYQSVTKKAIAEKNMYNKNISKTEELKKEIYNIKNPHTEKSNSNFELNSKNNLTTAPRTQDNLSQIKNQSSENSKKNEEILKELEEELLNTKNTRNEFMEKIESQKKINEKLDKEVSTLNNELSDKFSLIFQLETKLEKLKKKKQKQIEG
jgi:hypothetical protein